MEDRTPYVYLIGWTSENKWYYGVRFGKNVHPDDLWKTYFTSSKHVKSFRKSHGEPDVISIRKTFDSIESARSYEDKVIRRLGCVMDDKWLNLCHSAAIHPDRAGHSKGKSYEEMYGHEKANELKLSRSKSSRGRPVSAETKDKISKKRKGQIRSDDAKKSTSETLKLRYNDTNQLLQMLIKRKRNLCIISMCVICGKMQRRQTDYCSKTCSNRSRTQPKIFEEERLFWWLKSSDPDIYDSEDLDLIRTKSKFSQLDRKLNQDYS